MVGATGGGAVWYPAVPCAAGGTVPPGGGGNVLFMCCIQSINSSSFSQMKKFHGLRFFGSCGKAIIFSSFVPVGSCSGLYGISLHRAPTVRYLHTFFRTTLPFDVESFLFLYQNIELSLYNTTHTCFHFSANVPLLNLSRYPDFSTDPLMMKT